MRIIDAHLFQKTIREYRNDYPNSPTRKAVCDIFLSMLGDENQTPTIDPESLRPQWIPVAECMPEDVLPDGSNRCLVMCIVATEKGTVKFCTRIRRYNYDGSHSYTPWKWQKENQAKITHWMPMPKPPKEDA